MGVHFHFFEHSNIAVEAAEVVVHPHLLKEVDGWAHAGHHQGKGGNAGHK